MKRIFAFALVAICIVGMAGCFERPPTALTVSGVVTEEASSAVIAGVNVNVYVNGVKVGDTTTGLSGVYSIALAGIVSGAQIRLDFIKTGYVSESAQFLKTAATNVTLDVELAKVSATTSTVEGYASLMNLTPPSASVSRSGKVYPLANASVPDATEVLIKPMGGINVSRINETLAKMGTRIKHSVFEAGYLVVAVPAGKTAEQFAAELSAEDWIDYVEPNSYASVSNTLSIPNDPSFPTKQWNMYATSMPLVWDMDDFMNPVIIAVIDTGVWGEHPDLSGRVIGYIDTVTDPMVPENVDQLGHGTHVAGVIAAIVNNGQYIAGMNHSDASILAVKSMGADGLGTADWVAQGIRAAADYGADIIILSLGWSDGVPVQTVQDAIDYASSRVGAIIAAAGNAGHGQIDFPANQSGVICVGSIDSTLEKSDFSNFGSEMDYAAPGGSVSPAEYIYSTHISGASGYVAGLIGTSQSVPHVAALMGLLMERGLSASAAQDRIADTAQFNERNYMYYGKGIINAYAALMDLTMDKTLFWLADMSTGAAVTGGSYGDIDRGFEITCEPGTYWLVGWLDVDQSGTLNQGDYSGLISVSVNTGSNFVPSVLEIKWMPTNTINTAVTGKAVISLPSKIH